MVTTASTAPNMNTGRLPMSWLHGPHVMAAVACGSFMIRYFL